MAQPASTHIALGYIRNNTTMIAQDFTQDKELVTKALRIPLGRSALGSSPYLGTMDLLKRWPASGPTRSILLITSGIDYFRGSSFGPFYPDLDPLIQRAERQNTNIWTVYYPSSGHRGRSFFEGNLAQNNISKLSEDTGAESYFLGYGMPVTLKPYFDEIGEHLSNQYLLSFAGNGGSKGKYQRAECEDRTQGFGVLYPFGCLFATSQIRDYAANNFERIEIGRPAQAGRPFSLPAAGLSEAGGRAKLSPDL